jgi:hypothetical protein
MEQYAYAERAHPHELAVEERAQRGFAEVEIGFDEFMAREEAKRCLRCDLEWLERVGEPIPRP